MKNKSISRSSLIGLHFPVTVDCFLVITHAQPVWTTAREIGPARRPRVVFVGLVGQRKVPRKPGRGANSSSGNWKQPYGGGVLERKLVPGMCFMWLMCRVWEFQWAFLAVSEITLACDPRELISGMASSWLMLTLAPASSTDCSETAGTTSRDTTLAPTATQVMA